MLYKITYYIFKLFPRLKKWFWKQWYTIFANKVSDPEKSKCAEVILYSNGITINAKECQSDMYAAIDLVSDKLERQVKKHKEKIKTRVKKDSMKYEAMHSLLSVDEPLQPSIIRSSKFAIKPMYLEEAAEQLKILQQEFYVFTNATTEDVNVIYKVGSRNEIMGKSGIAHMLEHMNFKSTKNLKEGEFDKIVKSVGGIDNAFTSFDYTQYYIKSSSKCF